MTVTALRSALRRPCSTQRCSLTAQRTLGSFFSLRGEEGLSKGRKRDKVDVETCRRASTALISSSVVHFTPFRRFSFTNTSTTLDSSRKEATSGVTEVDSTRKEEEEATEQELTEQEGLVLDFDPSQVRQNILTAAKYNQDASSSLTDSKNLKSSNNNNKWNPQFCRSAVEDYQRHLQYIIHELQAVSSTTKEEEVSLSDVFQDEETCGKVEELLDSFTTERAMKALLRCNVDTPELSRRVREMERLIGSIGRTPLTDQLSARLVESNGKAGNVGRCMSLLQLRKSRNYPPHPMEFVWAVQSLNSAGLFLRKSRNVFVGDNLQPAIDNPTRWLDAILLNMHQRNVPLTVELANQMLHTYATTGRTGKAIHFFYQVTRQPLSQEKTSALDEGSEEEQYEDHVMNNMPKYRYRRIKVKMRYKRPPAYYKVPSECKGKMVVLPGETQRKSKLDYEESADWSLPLTAAFAFADSLTHGACGHEPLELDIVSWNILIKASCYRGSLWRAVKILHETLPRLGIAPDTVSYNTILAGLARVGDTTTMKEFLLEMTNKGIPIDSRTVEAMVDGMLNMGDVAGAITLVQDLFNQNNVLPPYTTHLKIIEMALASELLHEAKRHVYFLQQLWKWEPTEYHQQDFVLKMHLTQKNPKLSKESLKKLFAYFGERLEECDFA